MRTDQIRYVKTLEYYDGILLFEARDPIGGTYAASHIERVTGGDSYLLVGCDPERLRLHRHGMGELRGLLQDSAVFGWCRAELTSIDEPLTPVGELSTGPIPDDYLPGKGPSVAEYEVGNNVARRAQAEHKAVVEVSIDPPKSSEESLAPAATLVALLRRVETLTQRAALQSAVRDGEQDVAGLLKKGVGKLDVAEVSSGSVKVTFRELNVLGPHDKSPLAGALDYLDDMLENVGKSERVAAVAEEYNPGVVAAYAGLVRFLRDQRTGFSYTWSTPSSRTVSHRAISLSDARRLARELPNLKGDYLISEKVAVLNGILEMVDVSNKKWRLNDPTRGKVLGLVDWGGPGLNNITTGNEYSFGCREETKMDERKGQPVTRFYLIDIL